jgi:N-acetylglucosaminyldiphosphoundecaprenol N-acetyl-beta-D-mannosaminyltransferase
MQATTAVVCGVPVEDLTLREAVERICDLVERGRATGRTHQVVTVNLDFLRNALADEDLRLVLQRADLALADGMPVVWGARMLGSPLRERVAGADLVPELARRCAAGGYSLWLLGGADGVAGRAADVLRRRYPGLDVTGESGGRFERPQDMSPAIRDRLREARPDVLCVALGHPKQEHWIQRYREQIGAPVMLGVGGSLDFLVGVQRRAPGWMQRTGTEWFHRTLMEPRRFVPRYTRDLARYVPWMLHELMLFRRTDTRGPEPPIVTHAHGVTVVRVRGPLRLDAATLGWSEDEWQRPGPGRRVVIDVGDQSALEVREIGPVVALAKRLDAAGSRLELVAVPAALAQKLLRWRLYGFLSTASGPGTAVWSTPEASSADPDPSTTPSGRISELV